MKFVFGFAGQSVLSIFQFFSNYVDNLNRMFTRIETSPSVRLKAVMWGVVENKPFTVRHSVLVRPGSAAFV